MNIEFGVKIRGKVSFFGGKDDEGVKHDEGLALYEEVDKAPHMFLAEPPPKINNSRIQEGEGLTTGLARRLDQDKFYLAMRWQYATTPKEVLRRSVVLVSNPKNKKHVYAIPCDWGPHERTNRVADVSPGVMKFLDLVTDDVVECTLIEIKSIQA